VQPRVIIAHGKILAATRRTARARSRFHNAVSLKLSKPDLAPSAVRRSKRAGRGTELDEDTGRITAFPHAEAAARRSTRSRRSSAGLAELHLESGRLDGVSVHHRRSRGAKSVVTVFKRELGSYFVAYVFIVIFLVTAGWFTFFFGFLYERRLADLQPFFRWHPWLFLILVPALSVRNGRRSGNPAASSCYSRCQSRWHAVLGKFLAAWAFWDRSRSRFRSG
jgi:hypothetical protein